MLNITIRAFSYATLLFLIIQCTSPQQTDQESFTKHPTLPNPLKAGNKVVSSAAWEDQREYLKKLLTDYQYGEVPHHADIDQLEVEPIASEYILDSAALQQKLSFTVTKNGKSFSFRVGVVVPQREGTFPVIIKNDAFLFDLEDIEDPDRRERYRKIGRDAILEFSVNEAIKRGYVLCKFIRTDVAADHKDNRNTGVFPLYPEYSWGTIAAWAWAKSVIIDWLEEQPYADTDKIAVTGHSRGGKTALCAGIYDERITVTVPNSSGSGGTGSWRYFDDEHRPQTIAYHEETFPYWWHDNLFVFTDSAEYMPFDAHFNKMLIAPRALLNTHARHDFWANPYGTYLTHLAAQPIFDAYGKSGNLALHWRDGKHNQNIEDWKALYDFCDWVFIQKALTREYNQNPHAEYAYDSILNPYFEYFDGFGEIPAEN